MGKRLGHSFLFPSFAKPELSKLTKPIARKLPSWNRRGGAKRRGGRSQTIARIAFRPGFSKRPPRPLLSRMLRGIFFRSRPPLLFQEGSRE
jgi:hypothetical protein